MSADFKVYYDSDRKNVVVGPNTRLFAAGSLIAQADRGKVSIYYRATNYREVYLPFARFAKQDGSPAGASLSAVIDYLNTEFNKTPFVENATSMRVTTIDVGSTGVYEAALTVTDAAVVPSSIITANIAGPMPGTKDADELEFDRMILHAVAGTGQFTLYVEAIPGPIYGQFPIAYGIA